MSRRTYDPEEFERTLCTKCESYYFEFYENVCQVCGAIKSDTTSNLTFNPPESTELTMCVIQTIQFSYHYVFCHLKIDMTPEHLKTVLSYRLFKEPNPDEYYLFHKQIDKFNFEIEEQIDLDLEKFIYFSTKNHNKVYYNKEHFSDAEISFIKGKYEFE